MFLLRKIGALLRGSATPRQVRIATVLGAMLGFVPGFFLSGDLGGGFAQAPGLILLLLFAALLLNGHLGLFGMVLVVSKMLSLLLLPVSFAIGRVLLEGPLAGLFAGLIHSPVIAWFGLSYYATTGGLLLGLTFGLLAAWTLNRVIHRIRTTMANLTERSEALVRLASRWYVRLLSWVLLGSGKGKQSWAELAAGGQRTGLIRWWGLLVSCVLVASAVVFQQWFSTPILTRNLQAGLQWANGATVDLAAAQLDLRQGTLRIEQLAMADQKALDRNLFAAQALVCKLDVPALLERRFVIDELRADAASSGSQRAVPGLRVGKQAPAPTPEPNSKTLEDYLKDFEKVKGWLRQLEQWLDAYASEDAGQAPAAPSPEQVEQARTDQVSTVGYARAVATHLLRQAPAVLLRKCDIDRIHVSVDGELTDYDLHVRMLSTAPGLVAEPMSVEISAPSKGYHLRIAGGTMQQPGVALQFAANQVPVDACMAGLKLGSHRGLRGGTMGVACATRLQPAPTGRLLDAVLQVTLSDTTLQLGEGKETKLDSLLLPIGLRGPLVAPSVHFDDQALGAALLQAGKKELADYVNQQADKLLHKAPKELQGVLDANKSAAENQQALEEAAKKAAEAALKKEAEKAQKKLLEKGLKGLFGGKKN